MKIQSSSSPSTSRASVLLVIVVFLALMAVIVVSNNLALRHLDRSLRLIEQKQLRKAGVPVQDKRPSQ